MTRHEPPPPREQLIALTFRTHTTVCAVCLGQFLEAAIELARKQLDLGDLEGLIESIQFGIPPGSPIAIEHHHEDDDVGLDTSDLEPFP